MWRLKFARDAERMMANWTRRRRHGWNDELDRVRRHISDHGPTSSLDVRPNAAANPSGSSGWWDWHPSKTALEYLWRSGELAVSHRSGFRKHYDRVERVIPASLLAKRVDVEETVDWAMRSALERLGFGTSGELAAFFDIVRRDEAKRWCEQALSTGRIIEIHFETADGARRPAYTTASSLDSIKTLPEPSRRVRILSPFDPALRDRARTERLFGFRYRIEIFVPEAKRTYGYYVFPVLWGDRLVGRIDAKRNGDIVAVRAFWPEHGTRPGRELCKGLDVELERIRHLTGTRAVQIAPDWMQS